MCDFFDNVTNVVCALLLVSLCRWRSGSVAQQRVLTRLSSQLPSVVGVLSSVVGEDRDGQSPKNDVSCFRRCQTESLIHGRVHVLPSVERRVGLVWVYHCRSGA